MSGYFLIPVRRISPDEIIEFVEMVIAYSEPEWLVAMDLDGPNSQLTELVCEACLGNFNLAVSEDDRGFAALLQLKWGKDPETG
jgi:hypothetical protein